MRKIDTRDFQRATRTTPRQINRQIILNLVREHQPISRAELARKLNVARGIVGPLVNELLAERLIYEGNTGTLPRGRRPTLLHIRSEDRLALGIDVRYTGTHLLLSDFSGRELARERFDTPASIPALVDELAVRVSRMADAHQHIGVCEGIGLVVPGMVNRTTGRVLLAPTLGWRDVDLRAALQERVKLPVQIERDALACALAQMWHAAPSPGTLDSFAYVTIADGVGAGLVMGGELIRGSGYEAGEFGHIPLSLEGPFCLCGSRGCWEAYVSDPATIARYLGRNLASRESYAEIRKSGITIADVIARARAGEDAARMALEAAGRYLGLGISGIIKAFNPAQVVVGGEIAAAWDMIGHTLRTAVAERALSPSSANTPLQPDRSDGDARLRGAAALILAPVFAAPRVA